MRYFEGGALYTAKRDGKFLVITDESAMADMLSEEDLEGLELIKVRAFDTDAARTAYMRMRGWLAPDTEER